MKITLALVLSLAFIPLSFAIPLPESHVSERTMEEITDKLIFNITNADFQVARKKQKPAYLDWTSDGCTGFAFDEKKDEGWNPLPCCYRHDFAYRNYRNQSRLTAENRKSIDYNFLLDMNYYCESKPDIRGVIDIGQKNITNSARQACQAMAQVFYLGVRVFAGGDAEQPKPKGHYVALPHYDVNTLPAWWGMVEHAKSGGGTTIPRPPKL
ncbi:hypothetical protein BU16DRAFT_467224 [Lophium mytilinum]|uniref:Phospholipase A2 n=1 Tax=Lophium mytilinum TaxID=390894 RepID=A0A6A6QI83_9PEZI|nr:hypothetical protein BU16DRAFT_467224 [Lophium mytilinum]